MFSLLHAIYSDDSRYAGIRRKIATNEDARKEAYATLYKFEEGLERRGFGDINLVTSPGRGLEKTLGIEGQDNRVFGAGVEAVQELLAKEQLAALKKLNSILGDEESTLRSELGVSTQDDWALYRASTLAAGERYDKWVAESGRHDSSVMYDFVQEEYIRGQASALVDVETAKLEKAEQDLETLRLKKAGYDVRRVTDYFDPYMGDLTGNEVAAEFRKLTPQMMGQLGTAGRMVGIGNREDMWSYVMQVGAAEQGLRNDPRAWAMAGLTGAQQLFTGGLQDSLTKLAVEQFKVTHPNMAGTDRFASAAAGLSAFGQFEQLFGAAFSSSTLDNVKVGVETGDIENSLQLITELFNEMFSEVLAKGKQAASDIERIKFEFDDPRLQRASGGGVEFRSVLSSIPAGFLDALKQLAEKGQEAVITVPGQRTGIESERARKITVAGQTVYETGGSTYRYDAGSDTVSVVENISRREQRRKAGDKWYTYVDGVWDGKDPVADYTGEPDKTIHGTLSTTYDVRTGQMIRQVEDFDDRAPTTLFEGSPVECWAYYARVYRFSG